MRTDGVSNQKKPGTIFRIPAFEIKITAVLGLLAVLWIIIYYYTPPPHREIAALAGVAAAGVGALLAAFYAGRTLAHMVEQEKSKLKFEKKRGALYFVERWNSADMLPTLRACKKIWDIGAGADGARKVAEYLEQADRNNEADFIETHRHVGRLLNFMEEIAMSVASELVDEETTKRAFKSTLKIVCETTCTWRNNERARRNATTLWTEIDRINISWNP